MDAALGRVRRLPVRPRAARAPRCSRSTRRRRPSADRCTSATSFRSRTPTSSRGSSGCAARRCSIRWDGTTTGCRPSAACRTTTACAAIRRCRTIPAFAPPDAAAKPPISVSRPNFIELCDRADRRGREGVRAAVEDARSVGRLVDDLRDDRQARAARLAAGVSAPARSAGWPTRSKRRRCGTSTSRPRSRRPSSRIARCRAPTTASSSRVAGRRAAAVEIETTRPELIPACVALVAHPDDARYQPLFGQEVRRRCSASGCRCARMRSPIRKRAAASR